MHIQYLYTLQFLEFDIKHLEKAVSGYKQICKDRMDQGEKGAWLEHREMEMIERKILDAKREAHKSGDAYLE
ncbi:MAG: hypothetical protein ACMUJJ_15675 [Roseicyclus sp.]|uniref:hypothetical protein n=1 Tax=Roseicyclus sp. TaxID=1914329 RepID=UPI003A88132D